MGTFRMRSLIIAGLLFLVELSQGQTPANCSTGCWASRGECFWEAPTEPGLEPYWPYKCQHGENGLDPEICYCGRCWGCKQDTAACPNGKCSLRSPGPNFKPNGRLCNENDNCQCWEEEVPSQCKNVTDQKCKYDFGGICNDGPYLEFTDPTGYFCAESDKCQCYKRPCTDDGTCRTEFGGVCNETQPSRDHYDTGYMCNKVSNCTCWAKKTSGDDCIDINFSCKLKFDGECNREQPGEDYVPTGHYCLSTNTTSPNDRDCQCWGKCPQDDVCREKFNEGVCSIEYPGSGYKKTAYRCPNGSRGCTCWEKMDDAECPQDEVCRKTINGGICSIESPGDGYKKTSYKCPNGPRDCTCWEKVDDDTPCEKKSCPKIKGLLGKCSVEMPAKGFVKTDYLCEKKSKMTDDSDDDDASDCSCWVKDCKPKSKSKSCKGGYCWPFGISPGKSWEMAGYCNKFNKCTCWKLKQIGSKCKTPKACAKKGGECIPRADITSDMKLIKAKCPKSKDDCT